MRKDESMPNFIKLEEDVLKFWNENKIFEKVVKKNENSKKRFRFLDGPITANGEMGVHHAWNRSLKDFMHRYKILTGHSAQFQNGFDAQGLWVEVEVEKEFKMKDKKDIVNFGLENFTNACMKRVEKYSKIITEQSKRLGMWMDWDNSYFTNSDENITSIWYFLKQCHKKGYLIQKHRPMPWCSHCGTSISEHELADHYKEMEHEAVFFHLPIKNSDMDILVWTTTPWTLAANVAVAVNPELEYSVCKVKSLERKIIVCSDCIKVLKGDVLEIVKTVKGSDLIGKTYEPCFEELKSQKFEHKIVAWDLATSTDGTGAVHIAPGCGAEDFELGQKLGLLEVVPVDEMGKFFDDFGFLSGLDTNEVAPLVFQQLKQRGKLYYTHKHLHRYPSCWRCKNPLIFRLTKEWYIKADEIRQQLISVCDDVVWQPEFMKKRMVDWLTNMGDWNISRKRFYGLPLPFYPCQKCGKLTIVGSKEELVKLSSEKEVANLPHLHRPFIDSVKIKCSQCGSNVERVSEVGDCWLDAGITPFSTKKYFTDKKYWSENFPSEVVVEMKEQIRLWFYSLLFMSVVLTGKAPYEKVIGFAMLVSEDGSKFSKTSKNNLNFLNVADKIGADVVRYMYASNNMLNDTRFGFSICDEMRRKLLGLWNAYIFFNTYAILDKPILENFTPKEKDFDKTDIFLINKTNQFVKSAKEFYDNHSFFLVVRDFENLIDDLTNWYIRINRKRFWKSDEGMDKKVAYWTLYNCLKNITVAISPIIPFMSEHIWQNMVRDGFEKGEAESLFLANFPNEIKISCEKDYLKETKIVREVITLAQRLRNESQIKIKQPLKHLFITADSETENAIKLFENVLKDELNIKNIVFEKDSSKFNDSFLTINFKTAGSVLKGEVQKIKEKLTSFSEQKMEKLVNEFKSGKVNIDEFKNLDSSLFVLNSKPKTDFVIATENNITLVLDITIDESLMLEGLYRELVRHIQVMRKEADFKIEDRIFANFNSKSEILNKVISQFKSQIMSEALIKEIKDVKSEIETRAEIGGEEVVISLSRD